MVSEQNHVSDVPQQPNRVPSAATPPQLWTHLRAPHLYMNRITAYEYLGRTPMPYSKYNGASKIPLPTRIPTQLLEPSFLLIQRRPFRWPWFTFA